MILNLFQKYKTLIAKLRGLFYNTFILNGESSNLRVYSGVEIWGKIKIGRNVIIHRRVRIYKNNTLGDNVYLGDGVELRCNRGNKVFIGNNVTVNKNSLIMGNVTIGNDCLIAPNCIIVGSNHNFSDLMLPINKQGISSKGIVIENNVWIGAQVVVVDGVRIGEGAIIGAGSIVTKDIPPFSIAVGNPCKVVKNRS